MASIGSILFLLLVSVLCYSTVAQQEKPQTEGVEGESPVIQPGSPAANQRERTKCHSNYRRYSGVCTNTKFKLWGSTGRAQGSLNLLHSSKKPVGWRLPSARFISNALCKQSRNIFNNRGLNEIVVFFGQFVDHTIVSTPASETEMPIPIPKDDPIFANFSKGQLKFFRSQRARVKLEDMPPHKAPKNLSAIERPINALTSLLDLASVYGVNQQRGHALREFRGGRLKTSKGDMLPLNTEGYSNAPFPGPKYYLAGDHRANENPTLTALHVIFVREHNDICRELAAKFPRWSDNMLFRKARKINEAQFQHIVLEEYYPAMVGRRLPAYKGYKPGVNPVILDIFSTAAFRVGHTMVGNHLSMMNKKRKRMAVLPSHEMFFRKAQNYKEGVEVFLRGALHTSAQEVDLKVHDSIRNFLFTGIPVEGIAFDLISLNLQRGRDHALPTFNGVRRLLKLPVARSFAAISKDVNVQSALQSVYKKVDRVEAWVGMVAEDHEARSSMGRTMNRVWEIQFRAMRDGDRFYYKNGVFRKGFISRIPRLRALFNVKRSILRDVLVRNSQLRRGEVPRGVFFRWRGRK